MFVYRHRISGKFVRGIFHYIDDLARCVANLSINHDEYEVVELIFKKEDSYE